MTHILILRREIQALKSSPIPKPLLMMHCLPTIQKSVCSYTKGKDFSSANHVGTTEENTLIASSLSN